MIIAVDGPTASGKGTIGRGLARYFGLPHLDTGLLYRAVGRQVFLAGLNPDDEEEVMSCADFPEELLDDPHLRDENMGRFASKVSVHPAIRKLLFDRQRAFATQESGAVLDGRDIGSVIAPEADVKLYVTADLEARTARRFMEMRDAGRDVSRDDIEADLRNRDARDAGRTEAPLIAAEDAIHIDTSQLGRDDAIAAAVAATIDALDCSAP